MSAGAVSGAVAPAGQLSLEDQLQNALRDLACAEMIDNTSRMWAEVEECRRRVDAIKRQIQARDA